MVLININLTQIKFIIGWKEVERKGEVEANPERDPLNEVESEIIAEQWINLIIWIVKTKQGLFLLNLKLILTREWSHHLLKTFTTIIHNKTIVTQRWSKSQEKQSIGTKFLHMVHLTASFHNLIKNPITAI